MVAEAKVDAEELLTHIKEDYQQHKERNASRGPRDGGGYGGYGGGGGGGYGGGRGGYDGGRGGYGGGRGGYDGGQGRGGYGREDSAPTAAAQPVGDGYEAFGGYENYAAIYQNWVSSSPPAHQLLYGRWRLQANGNATRSRIINRTVATWSQLHSQQPG